MTNQVVTLDPVSRIEGHLRIDLDVRDNVVKSAISRGTSFRGFEIFLRGRDPRDAVHLTQRICGVCPIPHSTCASIAFEQAAGITINTQALLLRNLIEASNFVDSHLLHFYALALPDYVAGLPTAGNWPRDVAPRIWEDRGGIDIDTLVSHFVGHLEARRSCVAIAALLGGKIPHGVGIVPGGATANVTATTKSTLRAHLERIRTFVTESYAPDVRWLNDTFHEYQTIGTSNCDFLSYGGYAETTGERLFSAGVTTGAATGALNHLASDTGRITESVARSRLMYAAPRSPTEGETYLDLAREDAYSFSKAARYSGRPMEVGPLARAVIAKRAPSYRGVMARHVARAEEAALLVSRMTAWIEQLGESVPACPTFPSPPVTGTGVGLVEAPRGALGHWLSIENSVISRYQVISPTTWNGSPRDESAQPGPIEKALEAVAVEDPEDPIEVMRIVHSFDPCLQCAVH